MVGVGGGERVGSLVMKEVMVLVMSDNDLDKVVNSLTVLLGHKGT